MRCLITGGAGFIGSHLAEHLLDRGDDVIVLDDLSTGSIDNIGPFKSHQHFHYVIDSILNRHLLAELVDAADVVFHLAAAVGVKLIVESPVRTIETNVKGTEAVLEMAAKKKRLVLITSTSEVYGKSDKTMFREDDDLILGPTFKGRWSYAASKAIDEFLALAYCREKGLPVVIVRLFNTVGPRQTAHYGMVVPRFTQQALRGRPITVYGDGRQVRSFTWVGDVVDALLKLVETPAAVGEIFNVGHSEKITILELAGLVRDLAQSDSPIQYVPYEEAYGKGFEDMMYRLPDITKIGRFISYRPSKSLKEILQLVIAACADDVRVAHHYQTAVRLSGHVVRPEKESRT
jgi:UDP-glucose 4-epimerase